LGLADDDSQKARASVGRLDRFFYHLKVPLRYGSHQSWEDFIVFVRGEEPDG
jgi:hypothetical protein